MLEDGPAGAEDKARRIGQEFEIRSVCWDKAAAGRFLARGGRIRNWLKCSRDEIAVKGRPYLRIESVA